MNILSESFCYPLHDLLILLRVPIAVPVVKRTKGTLRLSLRDGTADAQIVINIMSVVAIGVAVGLDARGP